MAGVTAVKVLPQDKNLNIGLGALLMLVGMVVVFWAFSGEQAYELTYFYLAVVGTFIALLGAVLLANSRVVSTRTGGASAPSAPGGAGMGAVRGARAARVAQAEWVRMQCPSCQHAFEAEGVRPFQATCPNCGVQGKVA